MIGKKNRRMKAPRRLLKWELYGRKDVTACRRFMTGVERHRHGNSWGDVDHLLYVRVPFNITEPFDHWDVQAFGSVKAARDKAEEILKEHLESGKKAKR